jgi:hypothetical protein
MGGEAEATKAAPVKILRERSGSGQTRAPKNGNTFTRISDVEKVKQVKGFVALIDVLGFRELVGRDDDLSQVQKYIQTVVSLLDNTNGPPPLEFVLFSDNLIVNTRDDIKESFINLIIACSNLSFELIQRNFAVRGAITHGQFMRSPTTSQGVILAGRPIVEANHYQNLQNWLGIMLAPSAVRQIQGFKQETSITTARPGEHAAEWLDRNRLAIYLQFYQGIPFHTAGSNDPSYFDGYSLVPMGTGISSKDSIIASLQKTTQQLEIMKAVAPDPTSQAKYKQTQRWLETLVQTWSATNTGIP